MARNLLMWSGQALLALFFGYAGWMKLGQTPDALAAMGWHWAADVPPALIVFIGLAELLGAIGIVLPAALRILPWLTSAAASGMVLLQVAATVLHLSRGEFENLWLNGVVLVLAGTVVALRLPDDLKTARATRISVSD